MNAKPTYYRNRAVRSPIQPQQQRRHPAQELRTQATNTQDSEHPLRKELRRLCEKPLNLRVSFSEDHGTLAEVKTPGLLAVRAVIFDANNGKALGVGHGSSVLSRTNRMQDRLLSFCLNGALMSAINSACKTLDALRLDEEKRETPHETQGARENGGSEPPSDKQRNYLRQLIQINCDEEERERWEHQISELDKHEMSEAIASFLK